MRNRLLGSSLVVAMGYALSRLLGLGRDIVITLNYGTSAELDAFRASFGIIDMVYLVVAGGALVNQGQEVQTLIPEQGMLTGGGCRARSAASCCGLRYR